MGKRAEERELGRVVVLMMRVGRGSEQVRKSTRKRKRKRKSVFQTRMVIPVALNSCFYSRNSLLDRLTLESAVPIGTDGLRSPLQKEHCAL